MKKLFYVAIMTFVMIGFSSCSKDKLEGTTWKASFSETVEGMPFSIDFTLAFTTDKEGTLSVSGMGFTESEKFTYTFDGENGTLTGVTPDEDTGELMTVPFSVDGDELTIKDFDEDFGTLVFKKQK